MVIELGIGDWTRERDGTLHTDTVTAGEALLRVGLTPSTEVQVGWTALGHVRERDTVAGTAVGRTGTGDVTLALRRNLRNPDGSGFSLAVMPYASLPVGGRALGAGDWGAGLLIPASVEAGAVSLSLTPHVDAAVDADGNGRHLAYGAVAGTGFAASDAVSIAAELSSRATAILPGTTANGSPGCRSDGSRTTTANGTSAPISASTAPAPIFNSISALRAVSRFCHAWLECASTRSGKTQASRRRGSISL